MREVSVEEAKKQLSNLIADALNGETVLIAENERKVQLVPVSQRDQPKRRRKAGSAKGQILMADDFDDPLDDFKQNMQ